MMQDIVKSLRQALLKTALLPEPKVEGLLERPLFLLDVVSPIGAIHGEFIANASENLVAVMDETSADPVLYGKPRLTRTQFLARAAGERDAIAIDFAFEASTRERNAELCLEAGVQYVDCALAQGQLGRFAVYAPSNDYRAQTLARLDDFLALADRLEDDYSRATLYGNLLFRITYDRSHLTAISADAEGEYFSHRDDLSTFRLGSREHYVDCGAFQGHTVEKFLNTTNRQYASITAFEPDPDNYARLEQLKSALPQRYFPLNKALSNEHGEIRFRAVGTMGSHVSSTGNIVVPTTVLDDEVDRVTFLKLDIEGFEPKAMQGAARLLQTCRPRVAAAVYHYPIDLLDVVDQIDRHAGGYHYRLRQHYANFYYDLVLYASPEPGLEAPLAVR